MSDFFKQKCVDYDIILLPRDRKILRRTYLKKHYRRWTPYFNGDHIYFDLWVAPSSKQIVTKPIFRYSWKLTSPSKKEIIDKGTIDMSKLCKSELDMRHISEIGQYKIDIAIDYSIDTTNQYVNETFLDFEVLSRDQISTRIFWIIIEAFISVVLGGIAGGIAAKMVGK
jgi:hypothetical protein